MAFAKSEIAEMAEIAEGFTFLFNRDSLQMLTQMLSQNII